jgi:hypothetical protein
MPSGPSGRSADPETPAPMNRHVTATALAPTPATERELHPSTECRLGAAPVRLSVGSPVGPEDDDAGDEGQSRSRTKGRKSGLRTRSAPITRPAVVSQPGMAPARRADHDARATATAIDQPVPTRISPMLSWSRERMTSAPGAAKSGAKVTPAGMAPPTSAPMTRVAPAMAPAPRRTPTAGSPSPATGPRTTAARLVTKAMSSNPAPVSRRVPTVVLTLSFSTQSTHAASGAS